MLKFGAKHPFEENVALMVCENRGGDRPYGLITITGHKAGINPYVAFPLDCRVDETSIGLSTKWLIANWENWVWPDGHVADVFVRGALQASEL